MFLIISIENRLNANHNAIKTILELRNAFYKQEPARDPKGKSRLPILEEVLIQNNNFENIVKKFYTKNVTLSTQFYILIT